MAQGQGHSVRRVVRLGRILKQASSITPLPWATAMPVVRLVLKNSSSMEAASGRKRSMSRSISSYICSSLLDRLV